MSGEEIENMPEISKSSNLSINIKFSSPQKGKVSKPILAIFAASGNQGNSVANYVLDDPDLSQRYTVRASSRNISAPKMIKLQAKGAQLVQADFDDPESLPAALTDVSYVFFMTPTSFNGDTRAIETRQARAVCTEAVKQGVQYIIYSSMKSALEISHGKITHAVHFDVKAEIETYIRGLAVQSAFFAPASFMQNLLGPGMKPQPSPAGDGSFILADILRDETRIPLLDISQTGCFVGAILAAPDKYERCFFAAAGELVSVRDVCGIIGRVTGKKVRHVQMSDEAYRNRLPPGLGDMAVAMGVLQREYGYFGEDMEGLVDWAQRNARGKVSGLEEFLRKVGYEL